MNCENCQFPDARHYIVVQAAYDNTAYWQSVRRLCARCASKYKHAVEITEEQAQGLTGAARAVAEDNASIAELQNCLDEWGIE